ncbi:MAG: LytTR family DNA-binding domain-containing protein [Bacteroidota bacterium]
MKAKYSKIALQETGGLVLVKENEIVHAVAAGNYTEVHLSHDRMIRVLRKLKEVGQLLSEDHFVRIHRSHLINLEYAIQFDQTNAKVTLSNGTILPISHNRRGSFVERFTRI